ncbi:TPM domain-containing protein [Nodosilinea sp. LEGE 07088]|uniref:photosystem II repair protein Psb32 n=1 Tax=Nodosilinea sp. LEGE 07088 TaxID=2777968 RepID=UPI001880DD50|nr:TPM domain-containing protein [Nodosilinea sp. LEGE 07088]MBE9136712.1 TPM domain-containing protein [Nodosilinea sp. LEGE 07088]
MNSHSSQHGFARFIQISWSGFLGLVLLLLVNGLGVAPAAALAVFQMPTVAAGEATWIIDEANIISRINETKISGRLGGLASATGNEVRLVTLHHFDYGETVQTFTDKLFERWYPTPEDQANQTLLVLDEVTKTVGIRVGDQAATMLTSDIAASVAQETVLYPLLEGDKYNQSFLSASDRLVAVLSGQTDPGPPAFDDSFDSEGTFATAQETAENRGNTTIILVVLLVLATVIPMATYFWYAGFGN